MVVLVEGRRAAQVAADLALGGIGERAAAGPAVRRQQRAARPTAPAGRRRRARDRARGQHRSQEAGRLAGRAATVAGAGPGHAQQPPGAGDPDVEQPALLLHLVGRGGQHERQRALVDSEQGDRVPLQALGRVQRAHRHALGDRHVLGLGAPVELGRDRRQIGRAAAGPASACRSSATLSRAASDSQRSRIAPPPSGGCSVQPSAPSRALNLLDRRCPSLVLGRRLGPRFAARAAPDGPPAARRTARRRGPGRGCRDRPAPAPSAATGR